MKVILFSIGTRGDVEPFLAIAQLFKEKDWNVICVFPEQFREVVEEMDFAFRGFSKDFLELLESPEAKMFMGGQGDLFQRIRFFVKMSREGLRINKAAFALQHEILQEEEPDKVLYHPKCLFCTVWGMSHPGQSTVVSPVPGTLHSINHITILGKNYGTFFNRFFYWMTNTVQAFSVKKLAKPYLRNYGIPKLSVASIKKTKLEQERSIYTISPSLFPRPSYWPSNARVVGYYERDKTANWKPDKGLLQFLERHKKIVFISFGSMSNPNPKDKSKIIVDVLKRNKIPAVVSTSWGGLEAVEDVPNHIYFAGSLPYDWLFPKMYAVVHHGGSGTTHTAIKYACPSLVVPHILDQFLWEKILTKLQLGPEGIPIKKFNEKEFEEKLQDLYHNETYKKNAGLISQKMMSESNKDKLYETLLA